MDGFVADSSVGVAWAVWSQSSRATEHLLDDVASGRPFVVPVLWMFEVANSLVVLMRRRRIEFEQCARARRALSRLTHCRRRGGAAGCLGQDFRFGGGAWVVGV